MIVTLSLKTLSNTASSSALTSSFKSLLFIFLMSFFDKPEVWSTHIPFSLASSIACSRYFGRCNAALRVFSNLCVQAMYCVCVCVCVCTSIVNYDHNNASWRNHTECKLPVLHQLICVHSKIEMLNQHQLLCKYKQYYIHSSRFSTATSSR